MMNYHRLAGIDIGTNAVRLLVMNIIETAQGTLFKKSSLIRVPVRLGEDVFTNRQISAENIHRMIETLHAFRHLMTVHQVVDFRACATSAMREAENGSDVVAEIHRATGIQIEVIDGTEEAQLIFNTGLSTFLDSNQTRLFIDVGGGSTELTWFDGQERVTSASFNIGTIRLLKGLVREDEWLEMGRWVQQHANQFGEVECIGSGGNINKLFKMSGKKLGRPISYEYLKKSAKILSAMTVEERVVQLDLNLDRADVIVHATDIFLFVMRKAHAAKIHVPKTGLADGIIKHLHASRVSA